MERSFTEAYLVDQLAKDNVHALNIIIDRFSPQVYAFCFRFVKSREQAEELTQDTFIKLWEHRKDIRDPGALRSYIFTISKNLSFNSLKKLANEQSLKDSLAATSSSSHNAVENYLDAQDLNKLSNLAIETLSARRKQIFIMSRFQNMTYDEIAAELNISRNTVKEHIFQALQQIRDYLRANSDITISFLLIISHLYLTK